MIVGGGKPVTQQHEQGIDLLETLQGTGSSKEFYKARAKSALRKGEYEDAASALLELLRMEPGNMNYLRLFAEVSERAQWNEDAAKSYLRLAHEQIKRGMFARAVKAMDGYRRTCSGDSVETGRRLYHLCRSAGGSLAEALPLLDKKDQLAFTLREHEAFQNLDDESFEQIFTALRPLSFADREQVVKKGDIADCLFIVLSGGLLPVVEDEEGNRYEMALLEPGSISGETPFLTGQQERTADLYAHGPTQLYTLAYFELRKLVERHPTFLENLEHSHRIHEPERLLGMTPFFRKYSSAERRLIASQMEFVELEANEDLFCVGERRNLDFYVVTGGWLSVGVPIQGIESHLYTAKRGNVLGELGVLENIRKTHARAISQARLLRWPEAAYRDYFLRSASLRHQLTERMEQLKKKIASLHPA